MSWRDLSTTTVIKGFYLDAQNIGCCLFFVRMICICIGLLFGQFQEVNIYENLLYNSLSYITYILFIIYCK